VSALLESLALKYAKSKGLDYITDEARQYAAKLLGIDKQQGNPKYALSLGNMKIDPMRMIANQGIKSLIGNSSSGIAGAIPLLGAALGLGYMTNPLRKGSFNYNPNLQGQLDYAGSMGYLSRNNSAGALRYAGDSILSGQNAISGFGTNDYGKQLQKYRDKYADTMPKERLEKLDAEINAQITDDFDKTDKFMETQTTTNNDNDNGNGGSTNNTQHGSSGMTKSQHSAFRMARGGIANL